MSFRPCLITLGGLWRRMYVSLPPSQLQLGSFLTFLITFSYLPSTREELRPLARDFPSPISCISCFVFLLPLVFGLIFLLFPPYVVSVPTLHGSCLCCFLLCLTPPLGIFVRRIAAPPPGRRPLFSSPAQKRESRN